MIAAFAAHGAAFTAARVPTEATPAARAVIRPRVFAAGISGVAVAAPWLGESVVSDRTLELLGVVLGPVVVVMVLVQLWTAWLFRHRVDDTSAVFY